jgi:hypothetical protein
MRYFETIFLEEANLFLAKLDTKTANKIIYNIELAEFTNDPKLFKKLTSEIWEFRTVFIGLQFRLFAFWDNSNNKKSLVIATHGIIKKTDRVPRSEIKRAENLREKYFTDKSFK